MLTRSQQLKDSTVKSNMSTKKMVIDEIKERRLDYKQRNWVPRLNGKFDIFYSPLVIEACLRSPRTFFITSV